MSANINEKQNWFRQTVVTNESALLKYTMKIINSIAPSEEVVQDSFLKLWQQEFPGEFEHYPKAWLYKVCRNLAIDFLRKQKRMEFNDNLEDILATPCLNDALLDASYILREINKLSPSEQEVLILKFNDDLSYKEIAELTGLSVSNVGAKIHNALEKIKGVVLEELNKLEPTKTKE